MPSDVANRKFMSSYQGRSQDVSLRGVSVRAERAGYAWTFLGERSKSVTPAAGEKFLGLTARKTSILVF